MKSRDNEAAEARIPGPPSHLRSLGRFLLDRVGKTGRRGPDAAGLRAAVSASRLSISRTRLRSYLNATGGSSIAAYAAEGLLPPTLPAIWETAYLLDLLAAMDSPLPRGLVHLGAERICLRALRRDMPLELRLKVEEVERVRGGTRLSIGSRLWNAAGQLFSEGRMTLLLRGVALPAAPRLMGDAVRPATLPPEGPSGWREITEFRLTPSDAIRYATVSGDLNPIHLSAITARLFGFSRPILHGYCTEALIGHALIERLLDGRPDSLRRIACRLTAPLLLPSTVRLSIHERATGDGGWFRLAEAAAPDRLLATGEWGGSARPLAQG